MLRILYDRIEERGDVFFLPRGEIFRPLSHVGFMMKYVPYRAMNEMHRYVLIRCIDTGENLFRAADDHEAMRAS